MDISSPAWTAIISSISSATITGLVGFFAFNNQLTKNTTKITGLETTNQDLKKDLKSYIEELNQKIERIESPSSITAKGIADFTTKVEQQRQILNQEIGKTQDKIEATNTILAGNKTIIAGLGLGINQAIEDYQQTIRPLLDSLMDKHSHFKDAEKLLETISKHPNGIKIINELDGVKQQLIDNHYSKYSSLIQIGKYRIHQNNFPQIWEPEKYKTGGANYRKADPWVPFNSEFNSTPKVFVALAMIDSSNLNSTRIELLVDEPSISTKGFTAILKTWYKSKVYKVDLVWIAFAK